METNRCLLTMLNQVGGCSVRIIAGLQLWPHSLTWFLSVNDNATLVWIIVHELFYSPNVFQASRLTGRLLGYFLSNALQTTSWAVFPFRFLLQGYWRYLRFLCCCFSKTRLHFISNLFIKRPLVRGPNLFLIALTRLKHSRTFQYKKIKIIKIYNNK